MIIRKLALIALLGGALMAFGCSEDDEGGGGSGPTCEVEACLFCPLSALGGLAAASGEDINAPIEFTAVPQGDVVAGGTVTIDIAATSTISDLPVSVTAVVKAPDSTTTYNATSGGTGTLEIDIPEQEVTGTTLNLNGGSGSGDFMVDANATELVIQLTAALIDLQVTEPIPGALTLDASATGECEMLGDGVTIPVTGAGGSGGSGGSGGAGGGGGTGGG
jgi:hypothetical protein